MAENNSIETLTNWQGPFGLPEFEKTANADFKAAFEFALKQDKQDTLAIANNPEGPSFENTIIAMEIKDSGLGRVASLFFARASNDTNDDIKSLERDISPQLAKHNTEMSMNPELFKRVDTLYDNRDNLGLTGEELELLERYWRSFVNNGAKLPEDQKTRFAEISSELAVLYTNFGQNV